MAWKETCVEEQRFRFIEEERRGELSFAEICRLFAVSRKTGYKWLRRFEQGGREALRDQSRAVHEPANAVIEEVVEAVVGARAAHPTWGPIKLRLRLMREAPEIVWPAVSTIGEILKRHGLTVPRKRRAQATPSAAPLAHALEPNDVWCTDFKGWFRCRDGSRCDPLTLTDACSRFLLRCQAVAQPDCEHVRPVLEAAFRQYGLPRAIRSDNGSPFATVGIGGLSALSVWWIKLGVRVERIRPGKPQENGRHERMHRTLREDTARPPKANLREQQRAFDLFRQEFDEERPHAALDNKTPAECYRSSSRIYTGRIAEHEYPDGLEVRAISSAGNMRWANRHVFVGHVLGGERIGLEPVADGVWKLWFRDYELGHFDERTAKARSVRTLPFRRPYKSATPGRTDED